MIPRRLVFPCVALLLAALLSPRPAAASDVEVWSELDLTRSINDRVSILVPTLIRSSAQLGNPQLFATGATVDFNVGRYLTLTGGYLFGDLPEIGPGFQAHLPLFAATARYKIKRLTIADRNRVEKLYGIPGDPVRYRNRLALDLALRRSWHLFLMDEALRDVSAGIWNENRFEAGAGRKLTNRTALDVYYLLRDARHFSPSETHAIGVTLRLQLDKRN